MERLNQSTVDRAIAQWEIQNSRHLSWENVQRIHISFWRTLATTFRPVLLVGWVFPMSLRRVVPPKDQVCYYVIMFGATLLPCHRRNLQSTMRQESRVVVTANRTPQRSIRKWYAPTRMTGTLNVSVLPLFDTQTCSRHIHEGKLITVCRRRICEAYELMRDQFQPQLERIGTAIRECVHDWELISSAKRNTKWFILQHDDPISKLQFAIGMNLQQAGRMACSHNDQNRFGKIKFMEKQACVPTRNSS